MISNEYLELVFNRTDTDKVKLSEFVEMDNLYLDFSNLTDAKKKRLYELEKSFFEKIIEKENTNKIFIDKFDSLTKNIPSNYFIIEYLNSRFDLIFEIV